MRSPKCWSTLSGSSPPATALAAHDLFDSHLPLLRYEQQPGIGLAVRKYVLKRRGVIASDAQRKPAHRLSAESIAEIEWLLGRLETKLKAPKAAILRDASLRDAPQDEVRAGGLLRPHLDEDEVRARGLLQTSS